MLTVDEQNELALLEQEESQFQALNNPGNMQNFGLTPQEQQELEMLEMEEVQFQESQNIPIQQNVEADLGFMLRGQHALEPLESNRIALLQRELGKENVQVDEKGEVFVNTDGSFKPVNVDGLSVADMANLAGTAPEMIGSVAGGIMGMGAASVPGAIAGGAMGSMARQGLSALLGTPQVADIGERALETGISAAAGGISTYGGKQLSKLGKKLLPDSMVDKAFKNSAKKVNLKLSKSQLMGKEVADLEKAFAEVPILGRGARKRINGQIKEIKDNLVKEIGDFTDIEYDRMGAGNVIKEKVNRINTAIKEKAVSLFDDVSAKGEKVTVNVSILKKSLSDKLKKMGVMDEVGNARPYNVSAKTSKGQLTEDQFAKVQKVTLSIIDGMDETALSTKGAISATQLNSLRKTIDANIKETGKAGLDDAALIELREAFMDVTESMLGTKSPKLKSDFKQARQLYSKFLQNRTMIQKDFKFGGAKELADEGIVNRIFKNSDSVKDFIGLTDQKTAEDAGIEYLKNILSKRIGREKQKSAIGALNAIKEKRELLRIAFGPKKYNQIMDNLKVMDELGESINPSRTALVEILTNPLRAIGTTAQYATVRGGAKLGKGLGKASAGQYAGSFFTPTKQSINSLSEILKGE